MFDIKTYIHKGKLVSRNEKQKKTKQSAIKEKISGNNGTKEEKHSFFSLTGNTIELWCCKTKFLFKKISKCYYYCWRFYSSKLRNDLTHRYTVQYSTSEVYYHNNSGSRLMGTKTIIYRNFGTVNTKTPLWYQNYTQDKLNALQLYSLKEYTCKANKRLGNTRTRFAF